jgi:hypothetical protein
MLHSSVQNRILTQSEMGTGTKFYCTCCLDEFEEHELDPETGWCWKCSDLLNKGEINKMKEEKNE